MNPTYGDCEKCHRELTETEAWVYEIRCTGCIDEDWMYRRRYADDPDDPDRPQRGTVTSVEPVDLDGQRAAHRLAYVRRYTDRDTWAAWQAARNARVRRNDRRPTQSPATFRPWSGAGSHDVRIVWEDNPWP